MGEVLQEFERLLDGWKRLYAGRADPELLRLFLLALEREQLVSVGYREAPIANRLLARTSAKHLAPQILDIRSRNGVAIAAVAPMPGDRR